MSLSERNYERTTEPWTTPGRESEPPYFGWLCTELPLYEPSTLGLKTQVHTRPVGERPTIALEPGDHPLAVEQRTGITVARVQEIAERFMHPELERLLDYPGGRAEQCLLAVAGDELQAHRHVGPRHR